MKSRKSGLFSKRTQKNRAQASKKSTLRKGLLETLEARQLLASDLQPYSDGFYYPEVGITAADFITGLDTAEYMRRHAATSNGGDVGSGSSNGEDARDGSATTVSELEPNGSFSSAQLLPLGTGANQFPIVNVTGQITTSTVNGTFDEDWFRVNLRAGDIFDARMQGGVGVGGLPYDVTLLNANRVEIAGRNSTTLGVYPPNSPLTTDGSTSFAYVIPADGQYFVRVADGDSAYSMTLKTFRPESERQALGQKQIVYVDFDGASVRSDIFGLPLGNIRLSGLTTFFAGAGLLPSDEEPLIRSILAGISENFEGSLPQLANNGYFSQDGVPGHFDIEYYNSFDHPNFDPDFTPNVTKLIISGSLTEFPLPVRGIADSVDVGNFDMEGTVIVLPEVYLSPTVLGQPNADFVGNVQVAPGTLVRDAYAAAIATTASHELGHSFGAWHQDNSNATLTIMDSGGLPVAQSRLGVGPDGIFGTLDDVDLDFGVDRYAPAEGNIGFEDTAAAMAFGLSTGLGDAATITGTTYLDRNVNRTFDSADEIFPFLQIYADANNDGMLNPGEFRAFSNQFGEYSLSVPAGTHTIRQTVPTGYRVSAPLDNARVVTISTGATIGGQDFGNELLDLDITGTKFNDLNANGVRDPGEGGLEGVFFYLDLDGDNRIDLGEPSTQSGPDGSYRLAFPGPGTYQIREVVPPGFIQTLPGISDDANPLNDFEYEVVVTGDPLVDMVNLSGLDFGNTLTVDFGDAPSSYGIASHGFLPGLTLGVNWDAEQSSQFSATANGDDIVGAQDSSGVVINDEDGVVLARPLVSGSSNNRFTVTTTNTTNIPAYLHGWIDFNQDGDFLDANEHVIANTLLGTGQASVGFNAPAGALLGDTIARFRYSNDRDLTPTGASETGEVEDYVLSVVDTLELAVDDQFTVSRNSIQNSLDVLANDFRLPGETLTLVNLGAPSAGGTVRIGDNNTILYTPANGFTGQEIFTYTMRTSGGDTDEAMVVMTVNLSFENPVAVDDSFEVATNSIDFPLNVLANDIEGQAGELQIVQVTQPSQGGRITIPPGGRSLRYEPAQGFGGTETFEYTVADTGNNRATAKVTLHTLPGARTDDDVLIQLVATDLAGTPITAIPQGQDFRIEMRVDDLRFDASNPGNTPGVFAAYADILYDLQLVSTIASTNPNDNFNFDVSFFNDYTNFQRGNATIPGIVDEFGALNSRPVMQEPDPVLLGAITFNARSPGIANFMPDPADGAQQDVLLFDTPGSEVPEARIRYIGTSLEVVGDGVEFPFAVDDSLADPIPAGAIGHAIDVLANDRPGSTGQISLTRVENGLFGRAQINTRGTSDPTDDVILYTPDGGFNGADQFKYTIQDIRGIESTATVTVRVGAADDNDIIALRLSATDLNGQPIDEVAVGTQFQLRGYVQDIRGFGQNRGAFAAYGDVLYSSNLVSPVASNTNDPDLGFQVQFGPNYQRVREGDIRNVGVINEIGAVQIENGNQSLGSSEFLLFVVTMTANSLGTAEFIGDPADIQPLHDTLTFAPAEAVSFDQIRYGFDTLNIVSTSGGGNGEGFHNADNVHDVNNDGHVTPLDALHIITDLNNGGSRGLFDGGEGEAGSRLYVDVNADGFLSPLDAFLVINHINSGASPGLGEGELGSWLSAGSLAESSEGVVSDPLAAAPPVTLSNHDEEEIGVRMTDRVYGPGLPEHVAATDGIFEDADEELDDILGQLAPEIEETWKKNRLS